MSIVLPMVAMVLFSGLFTGAYVWMRRPGFGESERLTRGIDGGSMVDRSSEPAIPRGDEQDSRTAPDASDEREFQVHQSSGLDV